MGEGEDKWDTVHAYGEDEEINPMWKWRKYNSPLCGIKESTKSG